MNLPPADSKESEITHVLKNPKEWLQMPQKQ